MKLRDRITHRLRIPVRIPATTIRGKDMCIEVDGHSVRVTSERTSLMQSTEALGSAFLLPAASTGRSLKGESIDLQWLTGAQQLISQSHEWWGWKGRSPRFIGRAGPSRPVAPVGLAFSLGVDSFYSCFFGDPRPDLLILAGGFDVAADRMDILGHMQDSVAAIAEATGTNWTMVVTDLRRHPLYRKSPWDFTHGGALAFLGHLLEEHIGTLMISSSYDENHLGPWGSHPGLDPLWSSSRVVFRHIGQGVSRSEKFRRLLRHPVAASLVQRHLRVCWECPTEKGNCGKCHKCVMTRINLHRDMPGFRLDTMPETVPLVEAIESLPPLTNNLSLNFRRELLGCPDPRVEHALQDLIRRSEESMSNAR